MHSDNMAKALQDQLHHRRWYSFAVKEHRQPTKDITGRVNETEDFLELVINCHLISAAMHYFSKDSISDTPHSNGFDAHISQKSLNDRTKLFRSRTGDIIQQYVISRDFMSPILDPTESHVNMHASRVQSEHAYGFIPPQH